MPTSCAPVGDCISARTPLPSSVVRSTTISAALNASASANSSSLLAANCAPPIVDRLGQEVVAAQVAAPDQLGEVLHQEHQAEADHQAARLEDVEVRARCA